MADNVNHPAHYTAGEIECIDAIHAALGPDGFRAYCLGNVIKYNWRHRLKNGAEDLRKARVYQEWAIAGHPGQKPTPTPHHAIEAPMPPHIEALIERAESDEAATESLKAGEAR